MISDVHKFLFFEFEKNFGCWRHRLDRVDTWSAKVWAYDDNSTWNGSWEMDTFIAHTVQRRTSSVAG